MKKKNDNAKEGENAREKAYSTPVFLRFWKILIFLLFVFVEIMIVATNFRLNVFGIESWYVTLPVTLLMAAENVIKIWAVSDFPHKIPCYVIDSVALVVLTVFTTGTLISTLYIVILSEFYLNQEKMTGNIAMGVSSVGLFLISFAISNALRGEEVNVVLLITNAVNDLIIMGFHFFIFNFTVQIYRKNREIAQAFDELNESNEKLRVAYEELQEVTALEERQRIAKDIHDTAGHSITTVIMQTEAAKLLIDTDAAAAKQRIAAANLQAKNALEELRESVHLLSGNAEVLTLRDALLNVIHDSTDGTNVTIRYEIDEIAVCDAKRRFLCNSLKEGVSNGLRHGGATAFWFELKEQDGRISFLLSDNGAGMEIQVFREGFGLSGMQQRASALGGCAWFETEPDEGFEIHISLPVDRNIAGEGEKK